MTAGPDPVHLRLLGELDEQQANSLIRALFELEARSPDVEVTLLIDSPGGGVAELFAVYDTLQYVQQTLPVATCCTGAAAGTAVLLLAAGSAGRRSALAEARVHAHPDWSVSGTPSSDGQGLVVEIATKYTELLASHTGLPVEQLKALPGVLSAEESCTFGFVDFVLENGEASARGWRSRTPG